MDYKYMWITPEEAIAATRALELYSSRESNKSEKRAATAAVHRLKDVPRELAADSEGYQLVATQREYDKIIAAIADARVNKWI